MLKRLKNIPSKLIKIRLTQKGNFNMHNDKLNAFGKLGRLITKRKWSVIAVWVLLLAIIIPVIATASGYTATTFNSSTETNTESGKATDLIAQYFGSSVSNDSLILVISTNNASSIETQQLVENLVNKIKSDSSITGIENITSIYTILVPALNQTNQGVYEAYKGGNLSYTMLYSVPMIYSKIWETAYDTALNDNLVPGLNQANQGVYMLISNANQTYNLLYSVPMIYYNVYINAYNQTRDTMLVPGLNQTNQGVNAALVGANQTYNMLYSVPAIYLNVWGQTYAATNSTDQATFMANQTTAETLYAAD
jgi:predicted RND superfamily exporter protein